MLLRMLATVAPAGMPAPLTGMPTLNPAVLPTVTVELPENVFVARTVALAVKTPPAMPSTPVPTFEVTRMPLPATFSV